MLKIKFLECYTMIKLFEVQNLIVMLKCLVFDFVIKSWNGLH